MGGFVLAMTIIASYTSASSFVGGPGVAYTLGLGWVLLAMIQVPTTFFTLGVLGKRFAMLGRRLHAVTVTDFLYARYRSNAVVLRGGTHVFCCVHDRAVHRWSACISGRNRLSL